MTRDHGVIVHRGSRHPDFRLVERGAYSDLDALLAARHAFRSAWVLPSDTFVTLDILLLLTRLYLPVSVDP